MEYKLVDVAVLTLFYCTRNIEPRTGIVRVPAARSFGTVLRTLVLVLNEQSMLLTINGAQETSPRNETDKHLYYSYNHSGYAETTQPRLRVPGTSYRDRCCTRTSYLTVLVPQ